MASSMLENFDKYWSGCHIVMVVVAVLDLRYKIKILKFYFPIMYGSEALSEIGKIRQICYDFLFEYQSNSKIDEKTLESSSSLFDTDYDE